MPQPILTIVIPTYDRPRQLQTLLRSLLPQRDPRWKLLIVDNHSPTPVRDLVPADVEVLRNPVNIGSAGNFPRCFEMMDTDWVWMIGDDDVVDPDGVERVLNAIAAYPDAAILNFGIPTLPQKRKGVSIFQGFDEFIAGSDSLIDTVWMSANVYSRRHYWPHMGLAYRFANTQSSHYVLLMMTLIAGGTFVQLPNPVCRQADEEGATGNHGELVATVIALSDLPMSTGQRRRFLATVQRGYVELVRDTIQCAFHMAERAAREEILYMFRSRWAQACIGRRSLRFWGAVTVARLMLGCSGGRLFVRAAVRVKEAVSGRPTTRRPHVSRFYRSM